MFSPDELVALDQAKQLIREVLDQQWERINTAVMSYLTEAVRDIERAKQYLEAQ